jgi:hypothetical protein
MPFPLFLRPLSLSPHILLHSFLLANFFFSSNFFFFLRPRNKLIPFDLRGDDNSGQVRVAAPKVGYLYSKRFPNDIELCIRWGLTQPDKTDTCHFHKTRGHSSDLMRKITWHLTTPSLILETILLTSTTHRQFLLKKIGLPQKERDLNSPSKTNLW